MPPEPAPDVEALVGEIQARLRALPDRRTQGVRELRRGFSRALRPAPARAVVGLALRLLDGADFERRFVAYELIAHHREALRSLGEEDVERLGRGLDGWAAVDTFACYLAGP